MTLYERNHPQDPITNQRWCNVYGGLIPPGKLCEFCPPPLLPKRTRTPEEIIDRAERKADDRRMWRNVSWWMVITLAACFVGVYQPTHAWLHRHPELLLGFLLGSLVEGALWARDRWKWKAALETLHQRYDYDATLTGQEVCGVLHELEQRVK